MNPTRYDKEIFIKELMKLPKEMLVSYIIEKTDMRYKVYTKDLIKEILDIKISYNLKQQKNALDEIDKHGEYKGTDVFGFLKHNDEYIILDEAYNKLWREYEKLCKEREEL
ncbi:MAG: hypothetical protein QXI16_06740 [Sulfolobaceae archaeon]